MSPETLKDTMLGIIETFMDARIPGHRTPDEFDGSSFAEDLDRLMKLTSTTTDELARRADVKPAFVEAIRTGWVPYSSIGAEIANNLLQTLGEQPRSWQQQHN